MEYIRFGSLYEIPSSNGLSRPSAVRGKGLRMIGMGELFACNIIHDMEMERVQMNEREQRKFFVNKGDLLFARQSLVASGAGKCSVVSELTEKTTFESHIIRVRLDKNKCNPLYYFYLFQLPYNPIKAIVNQCAQAGIRGTELCKIKVQNPKLSCQNGIVKVLSTYDTLIENNTKRIRLLEKMAENLYKEWFVRFRFPGHEKVEMVNGLPKGWKNSSLFDVANVMYGYAFKSNRFCDNTDLNPVVRIRDIQDNHTNTYTDEFCDDKYLINKNAILIGMDGIFHMCLWNGERAYLNQRVVMLNSNRDNLCNYLLLMAIRPQIKYWEQVISGTTVAHLGDKHLRRVKVLVPDKGVLEKANKLVAQIMDEKNFLQHQNTLLARQRDLLLPRLMSGKLEVKEELLE